MNINDIKGKKVQYDYKNQAWLVEGVYSACNHPASMDCACYGKIHVGEQPDAALVQMGAIA